MGIQNYEQISQFTLDDKLLEELIHKQTECSLVWNTREGWPTGCIMAFVYKHDRFWLTAAERRARISAIRRFPRASVCVNSTGSSMGGGKTVTYKGSCIVHDDRATKDWFYPEFSASLRPDNAAAAAAFQKFLDSPHRVIIEFIPDYTLSFDANLMWARSPDAVK